MGVTRVVVMGVAGSGKSTVARELAEWLGARFVDADDLHPPGNVAKMASGEALTDDDRWPWLAAVRRELRADRRIVVACSALTRAHRDALRAAEDVAFVHLEISPEIAKQRIGRRRDHFMAVSMVASQFETLEVPGGPETDVARIDGDGPVGVVVGRAEAALADLRSGLSLSPLLSLGGPSETVSDVQLAEAIRTVVSQIALGRDGWPARVLLVPPDQTRSHGRAGIITQLLFAQLSGLGSDVWVLPALGTHRTMTPEQAAASFGTIPYDRLLHHSWRDGVVRLGEISADEVAVASGGISVGPIAVEVNPVLLDGWDLVVSIGQVVPHEVIGMANFTKNLVIGLGGPPTIGGSHFVAALCGTETLMGRSHTPVRDLIDAVFERFLAPHVSPLWVLTVAEDTERGTALRAVFAGRGGVGDTGGAAYRAAAALSRRCNVTIVSEPLQRVACWLDPDEFSSTWLANKAIYRTRMALAAGAELVLLSPGVSHFGEDDAVDRLIRRHGYRGQKRTLEATVRDPELAQNLGAAAHLIHGSSEGRFTVVYCTDPDRGGLTREELEQVGYQWRPLRAELDLLGVGPETRSGLRHDARGRAFHHVARPALGLWSVAASML